MRRIPIPENIQLVDPLTKQAGEFIAWKRWFLACIVNDQRMGTSPVDLARVVKLVERVEPVGPGRYLDMEEQDWSRAKPIVEAPQLAIGGPLIMMQLTPFSTVFLNAQHISDAKAARGATPKKTSAAARTPELPFDPENGKAE